MGDGFYPSFGNEDREALVKRNDAFLRALVAAHPVDAQALVQGQDARAKQEHRSMVKAIEDQVERLTDTVIDLCDSLPDRGVKIEGAAKRIIKQVAKKHGFHHSALTGRSGQKAVTAARWEAAYRIVGELGYSYPLTGQILGGRNHTTILYGVQTHARRNGLPYLSSAAKGREPR